MTYRLVRRWWQRDLRKEALTGNILDDMEGSSKQLIKEELSMCMSDLPEEESPIYCDTCGKALSFSALPEMLEKLDDYLEGSLTKNEAPMLESIMRDYEDEFFAKKNICRLLFSGLWNTINTRYDYSWDSDPWVWVIRFERVER